MGRILITGGAGFIGAHLGRHLAEAGYEVCLLDNYARGVKDRDLEMLLTKPGVTFCSADLLDSDSVLSLGTDFEAIYHLAAIVGVEHILERPYRVLIDNILMLNNVIALAQKQNRLSRFLFSSSSEVYAGTLQYFSLAIPTPEKSKLTVTSLERPRTTYMLSKIFGEAMCHQAQVPFTIFRPHNVYGPRMGMAHVIPNQLRKAWEAPEGSKVIVYSVDHRRSFCYIDDAIEMLKRIFEIDACLGKTLNVGTEGPEVTMGEVAQACIEVTGKKLTIEARPPTSGSPERRAPDMRKTKELLGYESQISLPGGISETWAWYRGNVFDSGGLTAQ